MNVNDTENIQEVIEFNDYESIRDQDGWETLELTVRGSYSEIADEILTALNEATPKILIMRQHYYGKGATVTEAWKSLRSVSGYTLRQLKKEPWVMYFGHDTKEVPFWINGMGSICHHVNFPCTEIDSNLPEEKS